MSIEVFAEIESKIGELDVYIRIGKILEKIPENQYYSMVAEINKDLETKLKWYKMHLALVYVDEVGNLLEMLDKDEMKQYEFNAKKSELDSNFKDIAGYSFEDSRSREAYTAKMLEQMYMFKKGKISQKEYDAGMAKILLMQRNGHFMQDEVESPAEKNNPGRLEGILQEMTEMREKKKASIAMMLYEKGFDVEKIAKIEEDPLRLYFYFYNMLMLRFISD
jgi:hypothetical protein